MTPADAGDTGRPTADVETSLAAPESAATDATARAGAAVSGETDDVATAADDEAPRGPRWYASAWVPRLIVALLAAAAGLLRIPGVRWGLPAGLHPDEWVITRGAIQMAAANSFEPPYFSRPDHLEMQLSTLLYRAYSQLAFGAPAERMFDQHPGDFLAISRSVTVAFGVAAVVLAYAVGHRFGTISGLVAAFLFAFFGPFIENGSFATPDVPLTTLMLAVVLASIWYIERPGWRNLVIGCALVALAVTLKYPGALGAIPLGVAIVTVAVRTRAWGRAVLHAIGAPAIFVASIFAFSPVLITDFAEVRRQLTAQDGENGHLGADGLSWSGNLGYYVDAFSPWLGSILLVAAVVGLIWCVRDRKVVALPLVFGVAYWFAMSALALHWARWGLPILITPLILAAVGFGRTTEWLIARRRAGARFAMPTLVIGAAVATLSGVTVLIGGIAAAAHFAATDTRLEALKTFERLGMTAENTVMDGYSPLMPGIPSPITSSVSLEDGRLVVHDLPGAQYAVVSSGMYPRYFASTKYQAEQDVYRALANLPVVAKWAPSGAGLRVVAEPTSLRRDLDFIGDVARGGLSGPTITVYRLPDAG
ncbi:ArnT family glycosyltransferase [Cellulomonas rhizosphaerae]|nr:glycosyltransferase family 39 protein [Cellulomonas rhizosphaerae]